MIERRGLLKLIAGAATLGGTCVRDADAQALRPNVILCMADDQGWGDVAYNGHPHLRTPNLDAMAASGLRFDRFYAGAPVCSPTRGSAITGRHPFRYGIPTANAGHLPAQELTLAELLKSRGYRTGHFGKWHLGTLTNDRPDGRRGGKRPQNYSPPWQNGFDDCFSTEVQMPLWNPMENQMFPAKYWTGAGKFATHNLDGDDSRIIMDRAIPFVERCAEEEQPFFAVIWFHAPHEPVMAGPAHRAQYSELSEGEQHFYGCISALDEQIGRLRTALRQAGVRENTMLWYCSDNGPEGTTHGEGRRRGSAGPLRGRKRSLFEGGVRVPGILEWPGRVQGGRRSAVPCSTLDYLPTIAAAIGAGLQDGPKPIDGVNLLPLIDDTMWERPREIGFETPGIDDQAQRQRLGSPNHALIGNRYKLLSWLDAERDGEDQLYDIPIDPGERYNLAANQSGIVQAMKTRLREWKASCARSNRGEDYP